MARPETNPNQRPLFTIGDNGEAIPGFTNKPDSTAQNPTDNEFNKPANQPPPVPIAPAGTQHPRWAGTPASFAAEKYD